MRNTLFLIGLISGTSVLLAPAAVGQQPATGPARWYLGASASTYLYFEIFGSSWGTRTRPAYVYGGGRLSERWSVQVGAQAYQSTEKFNSSWEVNGITTTYQRTERGRDVAIPILFRRAQGRQQRRVQADWLLGVTVLRRGSREERTETTPDYQRTTRYKSSTTGLHATGGIGLRYQPRQGRVFVAADVVVHKNLRYPPLSIYGLIPSAGANLGLGLRLGK